MGTRTWELFLDFPAESVIKFKLQEHVGGFTSSFLKMCFNNATSVKTTFSGGFTSSFLKMCFNNATSVKTAFSTKFFGKA